MTEKGNEPDYYRAYGETIAAIRGFRELKEEAEGRLGAGEPEKSVVAWLRRETRRHVTRRERLVGGDRWLALWILAWAKTGEPGPIYREALGSVGTVGWRMRKGKPVPMVWAVAGPTSDPQAVAAEFLRQCKEAFPDETWEKKEDPARDARWFRLHEEGLEYAEIDAISLEEHSWYGGANTVRQAVFRWLRSVTRIRGSG